MSTTYLVVTLVAATMSAFSAATMFVHAKWVEDILVDYGVPESWWLWLGAAKAAGAAGLLVGLFVPVIGVLAGIGLALYYAGAVVTQIRARWFRHIPFPLLYLAPVVASLALAA